MDIMPPMPKHELSPAPIVMDWLLGGYWEFADPRSFLPKVSADAALRDVPGAPYTVARLLAHANWWQRVRIETAKGGDFPSDFTPQVDDWPDVTAEDWPALVVDFLDGIDEIIALAGDAEAMGREVYGDRNVGAMFASHAAHNAYHLGQIALLLKMMGVWDEPPKDG